MYCAECGAESTPGLNYCKRCGSSLSPPANATDAGHPLARPFAILWPVALVSLVGLVGLFATLVNLSERSAGSQTMIAVTAFGGATILGVVGLLIWLLMHLSGVRIGATTVERAMRSASGGSTQPQLEEPPASIPSVTENTTRNFDPARRRDLAE
ncbi:MAG TPA: zinc ribbon domain-containing protein [Blastocatellia bacterium]|nr:zinc ribbon domain-containing protein [Blastocatellia bacterium]